MRCPTCGKSTPDYDAHCLNCGAAIASPSPARRQATDWEYDDFIWQFPSKSLWAKVGAGAYSEAGAKLEFWQSVQNNIYTELQKRQDDGWEPVGAVDSGCIEIRTVSDFRNIGAGGWLLIIFLSLASWGLLFFLFLIFGRSTFAEPVRCVIPMRREKQALTHSMPSLPAPQAMPRNMPRAAFPSVQMNQQFRMCPRCAHMNRTNAKFCSRCGQTL